MSESDPGCVKTCTSQERAKLFSLLPLPDSVCQYCCFPNRQNRDGISTRKLNVGVFTSPGPCCVKTPTPNLRVEILISIRLIKRKRARTATLERSKRRKQFCASSACARFNTAW